MSSSPNNIGIVFNNSTQSIFTASGLSWAVLCSTLVVKIKPLKANTKAAIRPRKKVLTNFLGLEKV